MVAGGFVQFHRFLTHDLFGQSQLLDIPMNDLPDYRFA